MAMLQIFTPLFTGHELKECVGVAEGEDGTVDKVYETVNFIFVRLFVLREYLEKELLMSDLSPTVPYEFDRAIDDWVFMCFFVGEKFVSFQCYYYHFNVIPIISISMLFLSFQCYYYHFNVIPIISISMLFLSFQCYYYHFNVIPIISISMLFLSFQCYYYHFNVITIISMLFLSFQCYYYHFNAIAMAVTKRYRRFNAIVSQLRV